MLLAATAHFDEDKQKAALAVLGAPHGYHLRVVLPIGLPDGEGSRRPKKAFEERVSYGRFAQNKQFYITGQKG
jgi:hypothetical protein